MSSSRKGSCRHESSKYNYQYISWDEFSIDIHFSDRSDYCIELNRCHTAIEICSWLGQIAEKNWATKELLGELVMAFTLTTGDLRRFQDVV